MDFYQRDFVSFTDKENGKIFLGIVESGSKKTQTSPASTILNSRNSVAGTPADPISDDDDSLSVSYAPECPQKDTVS